jgi:broad specificity phosphatase PhoE
LTLVAHASTAATAAARFPDDEPLDARGLAAAAAARGGLARHARAHASPAACCAQTAAALDLQCEPEPLLRDWELGRWSGQTLDEVAAREPAAVQAWLTEPDQAPHGGESLIELLTRAAGWLDTMHGDGHTVAVTHPAIIRGVLVAVLGAPPQAFWRIDIAPLTSTVLRGGPARWTVRSTAAPLSVSFGPSAASEAASPRA